MVSNYGSWLQYSSQSCADTNMRPKAQSSFKSDFFNQFLSVAADLELRRGQTSDKAACPPNSDRRNKFKFYFDSFTGNNWVVSD